MAAGLQVNDALCRITGHARDALRATTLQAITHPEDVDLDEREFRQLLDGLIPSYQVEKRYRHVWGHHVWVLLTVSLVRNEHRDGFYLITQVQDISERKELAGRLEYLVDHDFLTGLFNRRHFEQELAQEAERVARYGSPGAVLRGRLERTYRSVLILTCGGGTNEIQRDIIAMAGLGIPRDLR